MVVLLEGDCLMGWEGLRLMVCFTGTSGGESYLQSDNICKVFRDPIQ